MTLSDNELRRAVAEAQGWRVERWNVRDGGYVYMLYDPDGNRGDVVDSAPTEKLAWDDCPKLRDLADAALDEMAEAGKRIGIRVSDDNTNVYVGGIGDDLEQLNYHGAQTRVDGKPSEALPRAVLQAYLAWKGVNV